MCLFKKKVAGLLIFVFTLFLLLGNATVEAAVKKPRLKLKLIEQPKTEYEVGERLYVKVNVPGYGKKVEYRAVIWDSSIKGIREIWKQYPYYYKGWTPTGKTVFPITWITQTPGTYRLTVYVRMIGSKVPYEDYVETIVFRVKDKKDNGISFDKNGQVYGSNDIKNKQVIKDNISITGQKIVLKNAKVEGNIVITGNNVKLINVDANNIIVNPGKVGNCTLEDVTAKKIEIASGGLDSIHIVNVTTDEMVVDNNDTVRIVINGNSKIKTITIKGNVILCNEEGSCGNIIIVGNKDKKPIVRLIGNFDEKIEVNSSGSKIILSGSFNVIDILNNADIEVENGSTINSISSNISIIINVGNGVEINIVQGNITINRQSSGQSGDSGNVDIPPIYVSYVTSINIINKLSNMVKNQSWYIDANVFMSDGTSNKNYTVSSDSDLVKIDGKIIQALAKGTALINVISGGKVVSFQITIVEPDSLDSFSWNLSKKLDLDSISAGLCVSKFVVCQNESGAFSYYQLYSKQSNSPIGNKILFNQPLELMSILFENNESLNDFKVRFYKNESEYIDVELIGNCSNGEGSGTFK